MWTEFGFSDSPYRTTPLSPTDADFKLFTSRDSGESAAFLSAMDSTEGSVVVVSGDIGIGKTSFVNIQQHLLANDLAGWGRRLLPCHQTTSLTEEDAPVSLARRIVHDAVRNIESYCELQGESLPRECNTVRDWLSHRPATSGYQITFGVFGVGRNVSLPPVGDATLETWRDILTVLAGEVRKQFPVGGIIVCLDNAETLTQSALAKLLMSYRDTLFMIKGIWWILIGQSELYSQIERIDRRVSQRISGSGIELSHFTVDNFHDLIERRVRVYGNREGAVSPLSKPIHDLLFHAASGEVRFVFDTANTLVQRVVTNVREKVGKKLPPGTAAPGAIAEMLSQVLKQQLIDHQIPDKLATDVLKVEIQSRIAELHKAPDNIHKLRRIGDHPVTKADYDDFGFASPEEFKESFLEPMRSQGLLARETEANAHRYRLKGFAWLALKFGQLEL
jgi:hypothetical protein